MRFANVLYSLAFSLTAVLPLSARSQIKEEAWVFEKTVDFFTGITKKFRPPYESIKISDDRVIVSPDCFIQFEKISYHPSFPFQPLMKSGGDIDDINKNFRTLFNIDLEKTKFFYHNAEKSNLCNTISPHFITNGENMVFVTGTLFYQYKRTFTSIIHDPKKSLVDLGSLKTSPLPFDLESLNKNCMALGKIKFKNRVPQPTESCAPSFYPHVATRHSSDWLSKLVGSFEYGKHGVRYAENDYDNPVANGLHPVFLVLPPMNDIVVVRVIDHQASRDRDPMSNAYLSIKNKQVVDVLNEWCDFDVSYTCSHRNGTQIKYQLQPDGRFKKVQ